jgi:hypothetical protein
VLLATFVEAQKEGALDDVLLALGKRTKHVNLKPVYFLLLATCNTATTFLAGRLVTVTQ